MPRTLNRLTARAVATATRPGMYADGGGLYLRVGRDSGKSWVLRYMLNGNAREMGLGGLAKVGLADARKKAAEQRLLLADKVDPIEPRRRKSCSLARASFKLSPSTIEGPRSETLAALPYAEIGCSSRSSDRAMASQRLRSNS